MDCPLLFDTSKTAGGNQYWSAIIVHKKDFSGR